MKRKVSPALSVADSKCSMLAEGKRNECTFNDADGHGLVEILFYCN